MINGQVANLVVALIYKLWDSIVTETALNDEIQNQGGDRFK